MIKDNMRYLTNCCWLSIRGSSYNVKIWDNDLNGWRIIKHFDGAHGHNKSIKNAIKFAKNHKG